MMQVGYSILIFSAASLTLLGTSCIVCYFSLVRNSIAANCMACCVSIERSLTITNFMACNVSLNGEVHNKKTLRVHNIVRTPLGTVNCAAKQRIIHNVSYASSISNRRVTEFCADHTPLRANPKPASHTGTEEGPYFEKFDSNRPP